MVDMHQVEEQLKAIGCNFRFFGRPEIKELTKILLPGETIAQCTNGYYAGGIALLCVTDHRLLLVDRKPMFLTIEDLRFDMISEIDFNHQLFTATARIFSSNNNSLVFTSWNQERLRRLVEYLQHQIVRLRHHQQRIVQSELNQYSPQLKQVGQFVTPTRSEQLYAPPMLAQVAMQGSGNVGNLTTTPQITTTGHTPKSSYIPIVMSRKRKFPRFY